VKKSQASRLAASSVAGVTTNLPAPVREQSRERGDERTVGRSKPRARLLTSENRELVPKEHQFEVLGELGRLVDRGTSSLRTAAEAR
jgi:hypothetical protein